MSKPDFYIGDVRLNGQSSVHDPAVVSFVQGTVSNLVLTELTIRCDKLVELGCDFEPGDVVWVIVLEGLLTGKMNGKEKLTLPAKMIHLAIPGQSINHNLYQVRGQSLVQLLFIHIKRPAFDDWLEKLGIKHLYRVIEGGFSVGASIMSIGLSQYIALLQVITKWRTSTELKGETSRCLTGY